MTSAEPEREIVLTLPEGREAYPSDEAYANFREVRAGSIAPGVLYRSSSPIDPAQGERRFVADALAKAAGVATVVNTSDCRFRFKGFEGFDQTYYASLNHVALNMGHDYPSEAFLEDVANGLDFLSETQGPYLIHGTQGVERTGYVCMMLEALMGASREEILADYMRSYADYYQLDPAGETWAALEEQAEGYLAIFAGDGADPAQATREYLLNTVGLSEAQIDLIREHLSQK